MLGSRALRALVGALSAYAFARYWRTRALHAEHALAAHRRWLIQSRDVASRVEDTITEFAEEHAAALAAWNKRLAERRTGEQGRAG